MATWFFFYQATSGQSEWKVELSDQRREIQAQLCPMYQTALDVDTCIDKDTPHDTILKAKHRGDLYFDWDCRDDDELGACINAVNQFIDEIRDGYGVNPDCLRIYATGGRGFHIEVPWGVYSTERADKGMQHLPQIYREMARQLCTRFSDLSIYSAKRGRMWRMPNVKRENGRYKVQIRVEEMRNMTPERYMEVCSEPRALFEVAEPVVSARMVALFTTQMSRVQNARRSSKSESKDKEKLINYGGVPPTIQNLFDGIGVNHDINLNQLAMQLGIAAFELGITDTSEYLERIEGFIKARAKAPGDKHRSEREIADEMLRIYQYVADNDCYAYQISSLRKCLLDSSPQKSRDLDGIRPLVSEAGEAVEGGEYDAELEQVLQGGMVDMSTHIARMTEDGMVPVMDLTLDPTATYEVLDMDNPDVPTGMLMTRIKVGGRPHGDAIVNREEFTSVASILKWCNHYNGVAPGVKTTTDGQYLQALIRGYTRSISQNGAKYKIETEGMQLIPDPQNPDEFLRFWMTPAGQYGLGAEGSQFIYIGYTGQEGITGANVHAAPDFSKLSSKEAVIEAALNFNGKDATVAVLLGWLCALFIRPVLLQCNRQFPLMHIVGEAGSGKTTSALSLLQMFYYRRTPELQPAQSGTVYAANQFLYGSKTVPLALDEAKEASTNKDRQMWLSEVLHNAYTPDQAIRRGGGNARNKTVTAITTQRLSAPVLFIAEVVNGSTAIQERCVVAQFSKSKLEGRKAYYDCLTNNPDTVSAMGKALIDHALCQSIEDIKEVYQLARSLCGEKLSDRLNTRVVNNISAVYSGLLFFQSFVQTVVGDKFNDRFAALLDSLLDPAVHPNLVVDSEAKKTMAELSFMSHSRNFDYTLKEGEDYVVLPEGFIDLHVTSCYFKLQLLHKATGSAPLYSSQASFNHGLSQYAACVDTNPQSELKKSRSTKVLRFALDRLDDEYVEPFYCG